MHKAHITQHQLRQAVIAQTSASRETEDVKIVKKIVKKPLISKDQKITRKPLYD